jgi:hypothetical protein
VLAAAALATVALAAAPNVQSLVLKPAQVGKGYGIYLRRDGFGLKTRTLDLCGIAGYPSEKQRASRIQVDYLKAKGPFLLSNEVVRYKPGGSAQAMREVVAHATGCPNRPVATGVQGVPPLTLHITRLHDHLLLKGYLAVRIRATGTVSGKPVDKVSYAVYQRHGDVLSGVYSFPLSGTAATDRAQMEFCLHAAEQSAKNLAGVAAQKGPTA